MTPVEAITNILNEQISTYKRLVGLLQRACLSDLNGSGVEALSNEKGNLIMRLRLLEEKRLRLLKRHFDSAISLQELGELTGDGTLMEIRSKLLSLLQSIEELDRFDRLPMGRFLNFVKLRTTADFLGLPDRDRRAGADYTG